MFKFVRVVLLLLCSHVILAQNEPHYFKYWSANWPETIPAWAKEMYSADPDVFKVDAEFKAYFEKQAFKKTTHVRNYQFWRRIIADWISREGKIRKPSAEQEQHKLEALHAIRKAPQRSAGEWQSVGPLETYEPESLIPVSWQANVYCLTQSASDPNFLLAGTESGGVFLTKNKGQLWEPTALDLNILSVNAVGIHPTDKDQLLVSDNRRLYRSLNGGSSWNEVLFMDGPGYEILYSNVNPNTVFCAGEKGLFRSDNAGFSWTQVMSQACWDIKEHPTDPAVIYLLRSDAPQSKRSVFLRSVDAGANWTLLTQGWYTPQSPQNANEGGGKIAVTPADPDRVYVALIGESKADDSGWIGFFRSDNRGQSWVNPSGQLGGPYNQPNVAPWNIAAYSDGYHQGFYNFGLAASHINPDKVWIGTIRLTETSDGGQSFEAIGAADSKRHSRIHADIQCILVKGSDVWVSSDGGIDYSNDELQSHVSRKKGLIASDFWGFGSGWNEDVLYGGKYHNGNGAFYHTYGSGNFLHVGGVEEATGYVNPLDNRTLYYNRYWTNETASLRIPDVLGGPVSTMPAVTLIPNESYIESSSSGIYFDPRYAEHMIVGNSNAIWKSKDAGAKFESLYEFGAGDVYEIEISRLNPDVMYAVFHKSGFWEWCDLYRTQDGGATWVKMADVPGDRWRLEITLNPENDQELWVACSSGQNNAMVFRTVNGGQSWENKSSALLNNQRMKDILFQAGTDHTVYLATDRNVFYWDGSSWQLHSEGLPFALPSLELRPFYKENKLRLATYGRGIWETELVTASRPMAQPMTRQSAVYCNRDTVQFECHSVLLHEGASWSWTIDPQPLYISSTDTRNPSVVFGKSGKYSVTLQISNQSGQTSSRTETDMVEVLAYCDMDSFPITAMQCSNDGDYLQIGYVGLETNELTIAAWIKPEGIQKAYSGIFITDEDPTAGFNFIDKNNNTLGYHWPNGAWWWDSNLSIPAGEWSHVAMVVRPDGITLYANGVSATHNFTVDPVLLKSAKLGSYKNWGDRNFKGRLDEVSIWNRALSDEEIRSIRHLTLKQEHLDQGLHSYYQFNEPLGRVNDKVGSAHASLSNGAVRVASTIPAGPGISSHMQLSNAGEAALAEVGWKGSIANNLPSPLDLYVTRIQMAPNVSPADPPAMYWVGNVYGANAQLDLASIGLEVEPAPGNVGKKGTLHTRPENADAPIWIERCISSGAAGNYLDFEQSCDLSAGVQWLVDGIEWTTSTHGNAEPVSALKVYPNPVFSKNNLQLENTFDQAGRIRIFNQVGKLQIDRIIEANSKTDLSLSHLSAGTYIYQWRTRKTIEHGSFVIH